MTKNICCLGWGWGKLFEYSADENMSCHCFFLEGTLAISIKIENAHILCPSNST